MAGLVMAALPGTADAADIGKLKGTWVLIKAGDRSISLGAAAQVPYFAISGQTISGFDGCNQFSGDLDKPGRIRATRRGCKAGYLKLPLDLADPASHLAKGATDGSRLQLPARVGHPSSAFERK